MKINRLSSFQNQIGHWGTLLPRGTLPKSRIFGGTVIKCGKIGREEAKWKVGHNAR